ncbi:MAG: DEAD/DEAH box helicase [Ignavibacteria bacterium]|nr:DEAD/DEAH box helicase [Ignavibacteria bacterium]
MGFTTFGLSDHIMQGVRAAGYTTSTPIQSLAIGPALDGRDIIGRSQTGTGKTAAFVLPLLHRLAAENGSHKRDRDVRALVITPTRELAHQVHDAVTTYGRFLRLRAVSIYGGVSMDNQLKLLRRGVDIVIATPGRLLDHMQRGSIHLSKIEVLVLDEADRMLDMGFIDDVRRIIAAVPAERQTLLFSATLSSEVNGLAALALRNPHMVEVGERRSPVEAIAQHFYTASQETKINLLLHVLEAEQMESVLVFSRTKHGADKICRGLERNGITSVAIHSNRTQAQRQRALDGFKRGHFRVLVATDIAARGIDVDGISHVINFDIPHYAEDYIHRIGRTGRAGATGDAITFVARDEHRHLRRIEQFIKKRFQLKTYPGFTARETDVGARPDTRAPGHLRSSWKGHEHKKKLVHRKRPVLTNIPRKKSSAKKMETFSSDLGGAGWSNL